MKKILTLTLTLVMLASMTFGALGAATTNATGQITAHHIASFKATDNSLTIGESHEITFKSEVISNTLYRVAYVPVYNDNGEMVAKLYDNGQNGDETRGDGIYSATVDMFSDERKTVNYYTELNGVKSSSWEIIYYNMATDEDMEIHDSLWEDITAYEKTMETRDISDKTIVDSMYNMLKDNENIERIDWQTDYSFSFTFTSGITSVFARWNAFERGTADENPDDVVSSMLKSNTFDTRNGEDAEYVSWMDPDFVVFRPYRNTPSQGDFLNEFYTGIAEDVCAITGGEVVDLIEQEAYPGNLLTVDQYGFFIVDSHGTTAYGGGMTRSYMMIRKGDTTAYEYQADVSAGHLITSGNDVGVTGSFFTKYFEREEKTLPGTMFYLVICLGMATNTICDPLLDLGSLLVVGYDESVSFTYDFELSEVVWGYMCSPHPDDPSRNYTFYEAMILGKEECGNPDPYSWSRAEMQYAGNGNFTLSSEPIPIENVSLSSESLDMYLNNVVQLSLITVPEDANCYEYTWSSSDESVATIDENGFVTAIAQGTATITCDIVDNIDDQQIPYTATCEINVLGTMDATGIEVITGTLEMFTGTAGAQIEANVLPLNASNQTILYESNNTDVVTVDENGFVTPVSGGIAVINLTTADGGFTDRCVCYVTEADFSAAVNAPGGALDVQNSVNYPWAVEIDDERASVYSTNTSSSSSSTITLNAGLLPAGAVLKFDWKVSSETNYDKLKFASNGSAVSGISDISGVQDWRTVTHTINSENNYTFTWSYTKDNSVSNNEDKGWVDNVEIIIEGETYSVIFYDMDGQTVLSEQEVAHGEAAQAPEPPVHAGYTFLGWDNPFETIRSDLNVTAIYLETGEVPDEPHTVTFLDYDDTLIAEVEVMHGEAVEPPADPVRDGYVFLHWDADLSCITEDLVVRPEYRRLGDANGDDLINTGDASTVLRYVVDLTDLDEDALIVSDFNGDNAVNTGDAAAILTYAVMINE